MNLPVATRAAVVKQSGQEPTLTLLDRRRALAVVVLEPQRLSRWRPTFSAQSLRRF